MKIIISRSSDYFMDRNLPTPDWKPHDKVVWDKKINNWVLETNKIEDLYNLLKKGEKLILGSARDCFFAEIDDLGR